MSGARARIARINSAPSRSPEASPATSAIRMRALADDAAARDREEFDERYQFRPLGRGQRQLGFRFLEQQARLVQCLVRAPDRGDAFRAEATALQSFRIDAVRDRRVAVGDHIW